MADNKEYTWTAAITEDGDAHSAFVQGHVDPMELPDSEEQIIRAFNAMDPEIAAQVGEDFFATPGQTQLTHYWLREEGGAYFYAKEDEASAFPVTGIRFL